jgi:uncharacterized protein (TIGR02001 family)
METGSQRCGLLGRNFGCGWHGLCITVTHFSQLSMELFMKSFPLSKLAMAAAVVFVSGNALAQAKAPEPDYTLSYNAGLVTDYRYRGISQTREKAALQGGVDFAHKSGLYLGAWASTIKWIKDNDVKGPVELDLYGGYKGELTKDIAYDVGYLRYQYVGNKLEEAGGGGFYKNANTDELYGAVTYGVYTLKYSHSLGNLFGNYNPTTGEKSSGSGYLDLSASFDLGNGYSIAPHVGRQYVAKVDNASYTDYSLTLAKDFGQGISATVAAVGTNAEKTFYYSPANGKELGKNGLVLGAKYSF